MKLFRAVLLVCALALTVGRHASAQNSESSLCNQQAKIALTTSGTTTVITSTGNQVIHICSIDFAAASTVNVKFVGVTAGGNVDLSGVYQSIGTYSRDWAGTLTTIPAGAPGAAVHFGINLSGSVNVGGLVTYYQTGQ